MKHNLVLISFVIALIAFSIGCTTPLEKVVKRDAPGYRVKAPASASADLGRSLSRDGQPATNRCFSGDSTDTAFSSWSQREMTYKSATDPDVEADFGDLIQASATGGSSSSISVVLRGISLHELDRIFFNPDGPCGNDGLDSRYDGSGTTERVITRALEADSIDIVEASASSGEVRVNISEVGGGKISGGVRADGSRTGTWAGTNLFFAHYPEMVRVSRASNLDCSIGAGGSCDLGSCSLSVSAIGANEWDGNFSCMGGFAESMNGKRYGNWMAVRASPGVSYGIRVRKRNEVGLGTVDFARYTTSPIR